VSTVYDIGKGFPVMYAPILCSSMAPLVKLSGLATGRLGIEYAGLDAWLTKDTILVLT